MSHHSRRRSVLNFIPLLCVCAAVVGILSLSGSHGRTSAVAPEAEFADTTDSGLRVVPASGVTETSYTGSYTASYAVPTCSVSVSPTSVQRGASVTITWTSTSATSMYIDNVGYVAGSGSTAIIPAATESLGGTATGPGGTGTCPASVTVIQPTASILVNGVAGTTAIVGGSTTWTWSSTNGSVFSTTFKLDSADACGNGVGPNAWSQANTASGSFSYTWTSCSAGRTYTYTYRVQNSAGYAVTSIATVAVSNLPACTINLSPSTILRGQNSTLSWSTINTTSGNISPTIGNVGASGSWSVAPSVSTTYTGTVTNQTQTPVHGATKRIFLTSGSVWTVPSDWDSSANYVEVIGAGGDGGVGYCVGGGAGGGGAYSRSANLALTPGATISYGVGTAAGSGGYGGKGGNTWFGGTGFGNPLVGAEGGYGGANDPGDCNVHYGGTGGRTIAGTGQVKYAGGDGGYSGYGGGGGGGAAGSNGAGNPGGLYGGGVYSGGAGGGGADGGAPGGSTYDFYSPAAGGNGPYGSGGGAAGCGAGSLGGGGGGGWSAIYSYSGYCTYGGAGGTSHSLDGATFGPGGGGGGGGGYYGGGITSGQGGPGGYYGGGGGGSGSINQVGGAGYQGIIAITYTPLTYTTNNNTANCSATLTVTCAPLYSCSGQTIQYTDGSCNTSNVSTCVSPALCVPGQSTCQNPNPVFNTTATTTGHLQVNPSLVRPGVSTKLWWNVSNVTGCTVVGSNGDTWTGTASPPLGQVTSPITATTIYQLNCGTYPGVTPAGLVEKKKVLVAPVYQER